MFLDYLGFLVQEDYNVHADIVQSRTIWDFMSSLTAINLSPLVVAGPAYSVWIDDLKVQNNYVKPMLYIVLDGFKSLSQIPQEE